MLKIISAEFTEDKISEAQAAIDKLDVDKDGRVSYPEFILVMKYKAWTSMDPGLRDIYFTMNDYDCPWE